MIQFDRFQTGNPPECEACEAMLTDAIDGALSPADQAWFNAHITVCEHCSAMLADAQRGVAWLEMLKFPRPEPSAHLLEKILAQTTDRAGSQLWNEPGDFEAPGQPPSWAPAFSAPDVLVTPVPAEVPQQPYRAPLVPFRPRTSTSGWLPSFTRAPFEPRLAMTAAMAFFSIALTLNLTGVRLDRISVADLNPSTLKRSFYEAKGDAARRYDSLRVVHVLESRVDDLKAAGLQIDLGESTPEEDRSHQPGNKPQASPDNRKEKQDQAQPSSSNQPQDSTHPGRSHSATPNSNPVLLPASSHVATIDAIEQKWGRA